MDQFYGNEPKDVDAPAWKIILIDPQGIKVTWQEKYGSTMTENCMGLWENESEYMLTYRDAKKVVLEKSNTNEIAYEKLAK